MLCLGRTRVCDLVLGLRIAELVQHALERCLQRRHLGF
jgi:hypothetical protein